MGDSHQITQTSRSQITEGKKGRRKEDLPAKKQKVKNNKR
jgi:hypothetical protein